MPEPGQRRAVAMACRSARWASSWPGVSRQPDRLAAACHPGRCLLSLDAGPYASLVYRLGYHLPFGPAAVLLEVSYFPVLTIVLPLVFLLFPDGVLPPPRWRWVLWSYLTVAIGLFLLAYAAIVTIIVTQGVHIDASGDLAGFDHPSGSTAWVSKVNALFPSCWCSGRCSPGAW